MNLSYEYIAHFDEKLDIISQIDNNNKLKNYYLTIETDNVIIFKCIIINKKDTYLYYYNEKFPVFIENIYPNITYWDINYFNIKYKLSASFVCSRCEEHYTIDNYKSGDEEKYYNKCHCHSAYDDYNHIHIENCDKIHETYHINKNVIDNIYKIKLYNLD
jgi:hypothetical protein